MKISEVIEALTSLQQNHGDIPVKVYADHGQCDMNVNDVDLRYTFGDSMEEYMIEESYNLSEIRESELEGATDIAPFISISAT